MARLVELVSAVPPSATRSVYCLDRFEELPATELRLIGEDWQPVESVALSTQPQRWMRLVVQLCVQQDVEVSDAEGSERQQKASGVRALSSFLRFSENRERIAAMWAESVLQLVEPQARAAIVEEAKGYVQRGAKNAKGRPWWELRCLLRALSLFCGDEQLAQLLGSCGLLQFLRALTYHEEPSLCVQICRILSKLSFQNSQMGVSE